MQVRSFARKACFGLSRVTFLLITMALLCSFGSAATYYVSTAGSDSNPGTQTAPFRHLTKGAATATQPGDTVIVMDGTYDNEGVVEPNFVVTLYYSGTPGNPITFKAQNRGKAILDSMNTSTTTTCNGAAAYFNLHNAAFIVIQGFVIQRGCDSGIQSNDAAHDIVIKWNEIRNIANHTVTDQIGRDGIYVNSSEYNFTFDGNSWHDIGRTDGQTLLHFDHGIYSHGQNMTIINNLFYNNNRGWAIQLADGASNWLVANNTFAFGCANGEAGHIMFWGNNSGITVRNNIFYNPNSSALVRYQATVTNSPFDHNLIYGVSGIISDSTGFAIGTNQIGPNPSFVNASSAPYDFHEQSGGAGIDAGMNISGISSDYDANPRPQGSSTDQGAYEYSAVAITPPPVISGVFVSAITTNSAIISWTTDQLATSYVKYGLSNYTNTTPTDFTLLTIHSVTLSNLSSSTLYHFQTGSTNSSSGTTLSSDYTFTTAAQIVNPPPAGALAFLTGYALNGPPMRTDFGGFVGMRFTVGSSGLNVSALGRLFIPGNSGTHTLKLVQANNGADVPGASVSVSMAGGVSGQFKYVSLASPVTLQANTAYYVVSQEASGGDQWYDTDRQEPHGQLHARGYGPDLHSRGDQLRRGRHQWDGDGNRHLAGRPDGDRHVRDGLDLYAAGRALYAKRRVQRRGQLSGDYADCECGRQRALQCDQHGHRLGRRRSQYEQRHHQRPHDHQPSGWGADSPYGLRPELAAAYRLQRFCRYAVHCGI